MYRDTDVPDSFLARWDSRWKLVSFLIAAFGIAVLHNLLPSAVALALGLSILLLSRLPARWLRVRLCIYALATLPFLVILPFTLDPTGPGWSVWFLRVSEHGISVGLAIFCRCLAIGSLALVLLGTAPFHRTLAAAHKLKVPGLLVLTMGLAHRYAFLLGDEFRRIRVALATRGFKARAGRHGYRTLGYATGAILVRGSDRADRVAAAMRCRGFDGTFQTTPSFRTLPRDFISCLLAIAATSALLIWDKF